MQLKPNDILRHTLVSDGPSDANLIPLINWTLREAAGVPLAEGVRAELWRLQSIPETLAERIMKAVELFPCDVLFVHRDAEGQPLADRHAEICNAIQTARKTGFALPAVAVVPVRMLEAWLLFNEVAIRRAAGNPNGNAKLDLPQLKRLESRPDPKKDLREALRKASELSGRRLKKFNSSQAFWRIVDFIDDYSSLRQLRAFAIFESCVKEMAECDWEPKFYGVQ